MSDHETLTIQDCEYNLTDRIDAEGDAAIVVRNARLTLSPSDSAGISIVLKGESRLFVINSTISFARQAFGDCQIVLQDEAQADITETTLTGWGYVIGRDASAVYVEKSNIGNGIVSLHSPGVVTYGTSSAKFESSTVDGVYVWDNSTASVSRSDLGVVRTAWPESGKTTINITDSRVGTVETSVGTAVIRINNSTVEDVAYIHHDSTAWIEKSSIATVRATGNATVWLIESSVGQVSLEGDARVLVGWYLPLFELVGLSYSWIPMIQAGSIMVIIMGMAAVSYAIYRKKIAKEEENRSDTVLDMRNI